MEIEYKNNIEEEKLFILDNELEDSFHCKHFDIKIHEEFNIIKNYVSQSIK